MEFPEPIFQPNRVIPLQASSQNRKVFERLVRGEVFCFEGTYGTAMAFYSWLKQRVNAKHPVVDYRSSRENRDKQREYGKRLLVKIINHQLGLIGGPKIPWLRDFYPKLNEFYLPFTEVLGINGAWQWFAKGIQFPGLQHKVHPYFGAYFPTRTEHLELFDQWLADRKQIVRAIDLGTGCGVLSFYMLKYGVKSIIATDINPNSIYSTQLDLKKIGKQDQVTLMRTNFFNDVDTKGIDLCVFNPPWIPDKVFGKLDLAMYYEDGFFDEFFKQAYESLPKGCSLIILFSTFAQAAGLGANHPVISELYDNQRFRMVYRKETSVTQKPSSSKHWLAQIRLKEKVELWELKKINLS